MSKRNYEFENVKEEIITFTEQNIINYTVYIIRNIHSRFSLYIVDIAAEDLENFKKDILSQGELWVWIDTIESVSIESFLLNELKKNSHRTQENREIYFAERHIEKSNWFSQENSHKLLTPIISFYSFKGGLGRTTAMVLSAISLAREGKKVVMVDFDLEAPGLASIFSTDNPEYLSVNGVVEFLIALNANRNDYQNILFDDYYFVINQQRLVGTKGGEIVVIPAAATDNNHSNDYIEKLSKLNLQIGNSNNFAPDILLSVIEENLKPDYIFIDTRTGINDIGGMVINRYSSKAFLFFYGNQQNMFGLLTIIAKLKEAGIPFFLINSPVPDQKTDQEEEISYYVDKSYKIFSDLYYQEDKVPNISDESAEHYPINIPFSRTAVMLNNYSKLEVLLEEGGNENPYHKIAKMISSEEKKDKEVRFDNPKDKPRIVEAMSQIIPESVASSEEEYSSEIDLKKRFYPRKDYKYIFDNDKFLILGEKGSGKTALFAVLSHQNYAVSLAKYCGVPLINKTKWIMAFDKSGDFPSPMNFLGLKDFNPSQLMNYWLILLFRRFPEDYLKSRNGIFQEIKNAHLSDLKRFAGDSNVGELLESELYLINEELKKSRENIIFVYDYLDHSLPDDESNIRGRVTGALLALWYDYISRFKNIRSKIFLRKDIFDRDVQTGVTDKVKIKNYSVNIEWEYNQLLNIIWKRMVEIGGESTQELFSEYKKSIDTNWIESLGYIPNLQEDENRSLLESLLGKYMGSNNKAFPYNWIFYHVSDSNRKLHPRSILNLFSQTAKLQLNDSKISDQLIRPYNMENAIKHVSEQRVADLKEEYPFLDKVFTSLYKYITRFPVEESDLKDGIAKLNLNLDPLTVIEKLIDIGVLYEYKAKQIDSERKYHIPDLYLYGMGLRRKGPGAHKALFRK
jgi:hypothetical protein